MAGKRKTKNLKGPEKLNLKNLKATDVLCPICRSILIEPVTLPCHHAFCNACFKDTMENANLVCPLCRTRVGSWYRKAKKENKLIDDPFWSAIKDSFPQEVQNKYDGLDSGIEEDKPVIIVANPGEIRSEYENERIRDEQERKKITEAEEKASAALIKKIKEEEEYRQLVEEEKMRLDAELAQKIAEQLLPSTSKQKKTPKKLLGPMDKFVHSSSKSKTPLDQRPKEHTDGVLCLDKFPKHKNIRSNTLVMPVVQKKIQQIHKIMETEENSISNSSVPQSENQYYFTPIEICKRSPLSRKMPVKIPSRKITVAQNIPILSPMGKKAKLENRISAFLRYSISQSDRPLISKVTEQQSSHQTQIEKGKSVLHISTLPKYLASDNNKFPKSVNVIKDEEVLLLKKSNDNSELSSPQRKTNVDRKKSQSQTESPFLGFRNRTKNSNNLPIRSRRLNDSFDSITYEIPSSGQTKSINTLKGRSNKVRKLIDFNKITSEITSNSTQTKPKEKLMKTIDFNKNKTTNNLIKPSNSGEVKALISPPNDTMTEPFLGWSRSKKSKSRSKLYKSNHKKFRTNKSNNNQDSTLSLTDLTISNDILPADYLITKPFSGFETNQSNTKNRNRKSTRENLSNKSISRSFSGFKNTRESTGENVNSTEACHIEDLNISMAESFHGFENTQKSNKASDDELIEDSVIDPLNASMAESFHGFENTQKRSKTGDKGQTDTDVIDSLYASMAESFHGFESTQKNTKHNGEESKEISVIDQNASLTEFFHGFENKVSPEISTSRFAQKRQVRIAKNNGVTKDILNNPAKKRKVEIQKLDEEKIKRKSQEEADFELAKKLQSQYDIISLPKRTRRGTERQVTLDELLRV